VRPCDIATITTSRTDEPQTLQCSERAIAAIAVDRLLQKFGHDLPLNVLVQPQTEILESIFILIL
jgi:hypothetical protein